MTQIGLTGGIAAGKSTVARALVEAGCVLVDADVMARRAVEPGSAGLAAIVEAFGAQILDASGALDRAALGQLVFASDAAREVLNAIVHPEVRRLSAEAVAEAPPGSIVVQDIPLLVDTGMQTAFPFVIGVQAPEALRLQRMVELRGMTEEAARARIAAQISDAERSAGCDAVLVNDDSPEALRSATRDLVEQRIRPLAEALEAGERPASAVGDTWAPPEAIERLSARLRAVLGEGSAIELARPAGAVELRVTPAAPPDDLEVAMRGIGLVPIGASAAWAAADRQADAEVRLLAAR